MVFKMKGFSYPGRSPVKQEGEVWGTDITGKEIIKGGMSSLDQNSKYQLGISTNPNFVDHLDRTVKTMTGELPRVVDFSNMTREDWERWQKKNKEAKDTGAEIYSEDAMGMYDTVWNENTRPERVVRVAPGPYSHDVMRDTRRHEYKHHLQATKQAKKENRSLGKRKRDEQEKYLIEQRSQPIFDQDGVEYEYINLPDYAKKQFDKETTNRWQGLQYVTPGTAEYEAKQAERHPSPLDKKRKK